MPEKRKKEIIKKIFLRNFKTEKNYTTRKCLPKSAEAVFVNYDFSLIFFM